MNKACEIDGFRMMCLIRAFEEAVLTLTADGLVPGFVHPCTGHEAIAAGAIGARDEHEWVVTYYRCHGHALACGSDPLAVLREIMVRRGGLCGGKGGSMHLADRRRRLLGASSVVAAQLPVAAGVAMTEQRSGTRAVLVFCGDGALGAGVAYETLTIANLRRLPLLVVCEDNGWQDHTPSPQVSTLTPARLCEGLGLRCREVDGNDLVAVADAAAELLADCRAGRGPAVLVARTYLRDFHAQSGPAVPAQYRPSAEVEHWLARDPLELTAARLTEEGVDPEPIRVAAVELVADLVAWAEDTPPADLGQAATSLTAAVWPERTVLGAAR
jgi:acetoin:2,6-dichlorophenolindophenol oxidoreductase subunit alpha